MPRLGTSFNVSNLDTGETLLSATAEVTSFAEFGTILGKDLSGWKQVIKDYFTAAEPPVEETPPPVEEPAPTEAPASPPTEEAS